LQLVLPINIQLSKITGHSSAAKTQHPRSSDSDFWILNSFGRRVARAFWCGAALNLVGLGRIELPTSPLSGVRSSQLSYRPGPPRNCRVSLGRVAHGFSCGAVQAWWSWSGSNRRPPECKSGALPAELQPLVGDWWLVTGDRFRHRKPATNHQPLATISVSRPIGRCRPAPGRTGKVSRRTLSGDPRRIWTGKAITY
jgi:hypothetical protein